MRGKILKKRINIRVEHCSPSLCQAEFHARRKANDAARAALKAAGKKPAPGQFKRQEVGPRAACIVSGKSLQTITAIPYDIVKEGLKV